jgi:hypothetical protein
MKTSSEQEPGEKSPTGRFSGGTSLAGSERQAALQRVMLYLRALNLPPVLSLELALEALRKAGLAWSPDQEGRLPSAIMEIIWGILDSRRIVVSGPSGIGGQGEESGVVAQLASMPPLCRTSMVPEEIDRRPWLTALLRGVNQVRRMRLQSGPTRQIFYLALLLAALYLFFLKIR